MNVTRQAGLRLSYPTFTMQLKLVIERLESPLLARLRCHNASESGHFHFSLNSRNCLKLLKKDSAPIECLPIDLRPFWVPTRKN